MLQLKREAFGDPSVEVKSDWLRNPYQRRAHYLNKYGIDEATLNRFGFAVSALFPRFAEQIKIVACVFDKRYYKDRVSNDPCCNSCQVVLERIEFYMRRLSSQCILVVDQMESSLSAERGKNGELRDVLLNRRRMKHTFVECYRRIRDISFRESKMRILSNWQTWRHMTFSVSSLTMAGTGRTRQTTRCKRIPTSTRLQGTFWTEMAASGA